MINKTSFLSRTTHFIMLVAAISTTLSAILGWLLASKGHFDGPNLEIHKWLGIALAVVVWITYLGRFLTIVGRSSVQIIGVIISGILITLTGHYGGNLTHGETYLTQFAPLESNHSQDSISSYASVNGDTVLVFEHIIKPIIDKKCSNCHNNRVKNGNLNLSSIDSIKAAVTNNDLFVSGSSAKSTFVKRVSLPQDDIRFMPSNGIPLTYPEIRIVEWWIEAGATFEHKLPDQTVPDGIAQILEEQYNINVKPLPVFEKIAIEKMPNETIERLRKNDFKVKQLSANNNFVEVSYDGNELTPEKLKMLTDHAEKITFLNLSDLNIQDDMLKIIGQMPNLYRLRLQNNPITDDGLRYLNKLDHLVSLNLYNTQVSDEGIDALLSMKALKSIYLWNTHVSLEKVKNIQSQRPDLSVSIGIKRN